MTAPAPAQTELAEVIAAVFDAHIKLGPRSDRGTFPNCSCGQQEFTERGRYSADHRAHVAAHVAAVVADWYATRLGAAKAEHRREWADWLEHWSGAVCPEPPTIDAVIQWLRADHLPFGVAAAARQIGGDQ